MRFNALSNCSLPEPRASDATFMVLPKGREHYVVVYDGESTGEALKTLRRWASDLTLSFTLYDEAVIAMEIRKRQKQWESKT